MACCKEKSAIWLLPNENYDGVGEIFGYEPIEVEMYAEIAESTGKFRIFEGTTEECIEKSNKLSQKQIQHQCSLLHL